MKSSSSSQKCSGIPSDSISAKLSPSTWPTQGWVTDLWVSVEYRQLNIFMHKHGPTLTKRPADSQWVKPDLMQQHSHNSDDTDDVFLITNGLLTTSVKNLFEIDSTVLLICIPTR